jgi:tetratricopeptide (TPR) repeat protein
MPHQSTLEEFVAKTEDHGLTHAQVQVELAKHFMELKQWDKAWPYADAAAQSSGAQWALMCAKDCAVGKKDWQAAEAFAAQTTRRYTQQTWGYWFLFCIESGHGNPAAARSFVEEYLKPIDDHPNLATPTAIGYFYWLSGDPKTAMLWFRAAHTRAAGAYTCFNLILLADEIGDAVTRDEMIRVLLARYRRQAPVACQIYEILRNALNQDKPGSVDLKAIDAILAKAPPPSRGLNAWLVGLFLKNHGQADDARRYLKLSLELPGVHEWGQAKAAVLLRGIDGDEAAPPSGVRLK